MPDDLILLPKAKHRGEVCGRHQDRHHAVSDAIKVGREPGMPLDALAQAVRQPPLAALSFALLVGIAFARPRR
jgi:hypothetical protein